MSKDQWFSHSHMQSSTILNQDRRSMSSDMLRQKLIQKGVSSLDNVSLVSLLIGATYGVGCDSIILAKRVLHGLGSLNRLLTTNLDDLCKIKGIGPVKAARLLVTAELMKRIYQAELGFQKVQALQHLVVEKVRLTCNETVPLLMACSLEQSYTDTPQEKIEIALQSAHTLSLSSDLGDIDQHSRWLAKLLLHNPVAHWLIISLRHYDQLLASETEGIAHFAELALAMNVSLDQILVLSPTQYWTVLDTEEMGL